MRTLLSGPICALVGVCAIACDRSGEAGGVDGGVVDQGGAEMPEDTGADGTVDVPGGGPLRASFIVTPTFMGTTKCLSPFIGPEMNPFLLHIDESAKIVFLHLGDRVVTLAIDRDGGDWKGQLFDASPPFTSCRQTTMLTYQTFRFRASASALEGAGKGSFSAIYSDIGCSGDFTATWKGVPDSLTPGIHVSVDPLYGVRITANEPLRPGLIAHIEREGTDPVLVGDASEKGPRLQFATLEALPFGSTVKVSIEPSLFDLVGREGKAMAMGADAADPGLLDGTFEGEVHARMVGGFKVVDATVAPPVTGKRALYLPPGNFEARFLAHMTVPAGATKMKLTARGVSGYLGTTSVPLRIAWAATGTKAMAASFPAPSGPFEALPGDSVLRIGSPFSKSLDLVEGSTEVVFEFARGTTLDCGPSPSLRDGILIDDIHFE